MALELVGKEKWLIRYYGPPDERGKRKQLKKTFYGGKKQAEQEEARLVAESNGPAGPGTQITAAAEARLTFGVWLEEWLSRKSDTQIGPQTLRAYQTHVKAIKAGLGEVPLTGLTPKQIADYYRNARKDGRRLDRDDRGTGLSRTTIRHHHVLIRAALKQAVTMGVIDRDPTDALEAPEIEKDRQMPSLTPDQVKLLVSAAEGTNLYVPVVLALYTGLREGEVLALAWEKVDLELGYLIVSANAYPKTGGGMAFKEPKSARSRRPVPLVPLVVEVLKRHKRLQAVSRENPDWQERGLVVTMEDGRPMRNDYLTKQFRLLRSQLELAENVSFHCLRRTCATLMAHAGVAPRVTQEFMGHANLQTTLGVYTNVVDGAREDAASRLAAILHPQP